METDKEKVIDWALNYATYEELEETAKALYALYVQQRKHDYPDKHRIAKKRKVYYKHKLDRM